MTRQKNLPVYLLAFFLFAGGIGFLAWSGLSESSVYFLNVSEALAMPAGELNTARLFGTVADDGLRRADGGLGVQFLLKDAEKPEQVLSVDYQGAVPDTFKPGAEVIVEGEMGKGGFEARTLMTKCPSKYEKSNRG